MLAASSSPLLVRYRYLPGDTIHAFVGGNAKALLHRLNLLSRKPNLYLSRQQQRQNAAANYRPLIYQLDEHGSRALRERGLASLPKSYHHNFAHELMAAQITASLELGTKENSTVRLVTWPEILAHERMPIATRESANPTAIRVTYSLRGEPRRDEINADARPFGLERTIDGKTSYLWARSFSPAFRSNGALNIDSQTATEFRSIRRTRKRPCVCLRCTQWTICWLMPFRRAYGRALLAFAHQAPDSGSRPFGDDPFAEKRRPFPIRTRHGDNRRGVERAALSLPL